MAIFAAGVRGALGGNGGRMAVVVAKWRSEGAHETWDGAGQGKAEGKKKRRTTKKDGVARLKRVMDQQVALYVEELAHLLMERALHGDIPTARLMVALAEEGKPQEKKKKRHGPSLAERWAASPEWTGKKVNVPVVLEEVTGEMRWGMG